MTYLLCYDIQYSIAVTATASVFPCHEVSTFIGEEEVDCGNSWVVEDVECHELVDGWRLDQADANCSPEPCFLACGVPSIFIQELVMDSHKVRWFLSWWKECFP